MEDHSQNERPPVFGKWSGWYLLVIGFMLLQLVLYSIITLSFK